MLWIEEEPIIILFWAVVGFGSGAVPWAVLLGRVASGKDIRNIGDGNPGVANTWKLAGWKWGVAASCIEILKGSVPTVLALTVSGVAGWGLYLIGFATILGHAFNPLLGFRGGKAIAVSSGVWAALTPWGLGLLVLCTCGAILHILQETHAWTVILGFVLFGLFVGLWFHDDYTLVLWALNLFLLIWKHRLELKQRVLPRRWIRALLGMKS